MSEAAQTTNPRHKWYIVHAYSNFEKKVAESIKEQAHAQGLDDAFSEILVPTEDVVEIRRGRKVNSERKYFPGYVLVKMDMTDEAYHLVKNTPKVTGFLGSGSKPMPVSEREVARIIGAIEEGVERPKPTITFEIGEQVRVTDGPFASSGLIHRRSSWPSPGRAGLVVVPLPPWSTTDTGPPLRASARRRLRKQA
jgi:transcriptional antiterminator NusG